MGELKGTVNFVSGNVIEKLALVLLRLRLPVFFCGLKQGERTHNVSSGEGEGIFYRAVNMTLGSEMNDAINMIFPYYASHLVKVSNVSLDKSLVWFTLDVIKVGKITSIGELI